MRAHPVAALIIIAACHPHDDQVTDLATRAKPTLEALRAPVAVVLSSASDERTVIEACGQAIDASKPIWFVDFGDEMTGPGARLSIKEVMDIFAIDREVACRPDEGDGRRNARCARWCREQLGALADAVDRFRVRASAAGVEIPGLR